CPCHRGFFVSRMGRKYGRHWAVLLARSGRFYCPPMGSFPWPPTLNLFHLLAEINGCPPTLVPNDWAEFDLKVLDDFDNVVISPGPGTPERSADFGICAVVIAGSSIPVLGVCLGH